MFLPVLQPTAKMFFCLSLEKTFVILPWLSSFLLSGFCEVTAKFLLIVYIPTDSQKGSKMARSPNNFANPGSLFYSRPSVLHHEVTVLNL